MAAISAIWTAISTSSSIRDRPLAHYNTLCVHHGLFPASAACRNNPVIACWLFLPVRTSTSLSLIMPVGPRASSGSRYLAVPSHTIDYQRGSRIMRRP